MAEATISGIDQLILLADMAQGEFATDAAEVILAGYDLARDMLSRRGDRVSWGIKYLDECRDEALTAIGAFADLNPTDHAGMLACQQKVRDYKRVAKFVDDLLRQASSVAGGKPDDMEPGDGVGEEIGEGFGES